MGCVELDGHSVLKMGEGWESNFLEKRWNSNSGSNGEAVCEGHGFNPTQCEAVGCCQWDDGQVDWWQEWVLISLATLPSYHPQCWSAVGNGQCGSSGSGGGQTGSGSQTSPPSSPSPTGPTGAIQFLMQKNFNSSELLCLSQSREKHNISAVHNSPHPSSTIK